MKDIKTLANEFGINEIQLRGDFIAKVDVNNKNFETKIDNTICQKSMACESEFVKTEKCEKKCEDTSVNVDMSIVNMKSQTEKQTKTQIETQTKNQINNQTKNQSKLVLVSAMTSNAAGIGKTTVAIGLSDALNKIGKKTLLTLREPSMGPVFGMKGGATGGGKSSVFPSDEINLHFTGDFHAVAQANNLLSSVIDNHIYFGNQLHIDPNKIFFKRCLDINDRSLREIEYKIRDTKIKTGFNITAASEIMTVICVSKNLADLKNNLGNILVALSTEQQPIFARDLQVVDAMMILLADAMEPNLVQTTGENLALVHMGPFANIAHGCNSVIATQYALDHADICVTEAGFGTDLGAEKFVDIKCRILNRTPNACVLVATVDAVLEQGYGNLEDGFKNVKKHIQNLKDVFQLNTVVAINVHDGDKKENVNALQKMCEEENLPAVCCFPVEAGATGCLALANVVSKLIEKENSTKFVYEVDDPLETKILKIATKIYGAKKVTYSQIAQDKLDLAKNLGFDNFFVNIAKTPFSLSDNKNFFGAPKDFEFHITDFEIRSGAKMIVPIAGDMLLMPGLAKKSNYMDMKFDV